MLTKPLSSYKMIGLSFRTSLQPFAQTILHHKSNLTLFYVDHPGFLIRQFVMDTQYQYHKLNLLYPEEEECSEL